MLKFAMCKYTFILIYTYFMMENKILLAFINIDGNIFAPQIDIIK